MRKSFLLVMAMPLLAQEPLSLREAVRLALRENQSIAAANAGMRASAARIDEAHAGRLPKLNYSESFARSDNPVYVFSSLLTQHQFGAGNFNIGPLNRPDSLNNFQSLLTVDQPLYDAGQTRDAVKSVVNVHTFRLFLCLYKIDKTLGLLDDDPHKNRCSTIHFCHLT